MTSSYFDFLATTVWTLCSGDYGPSMTVDKLKDFHRRRLVVLADAGPDLLAIETIPCKLETQVCYCSGLEVERKLAGCDEGGVKLILRYFVCGFMHMSFSHDDENPV